MKKQLKEAIFLSLVGGRTIMNKKSWILYVYAFTFSCFLYALISIFLRPFRWSSMFLTAFTTIIILAILRKRGKKKDA